MSASDSERTFTASRLAGTKILLFALINGKTEELFRCGREYTSSALTEGDDRDIMSHSRSEIFLGPSTIIKQSSGCILELAKCGVIA
jgi:hypothetical protein